MPTYKILFVGLGKMGFHMAGYLSKNKNFKLFVFNRTKSVEHKWKKKFIDAPITGGEEGAKKGSLSVMVGGTEQNFNKSKSIISSYSKSITHMGKLGSGQLTKFTNQILICGILYSISELIFLVKKIILIKKKFLML